ncbi:MAG: hypothetical protein ABWY82_05655, partial [Tardiphaga sp.]
VSANVASGSDSEVELADVDFRFTPQSRHPTGGLECLLRANFGSDLISFCHLIGPSTDRSGRFSQSAALPPS